jgi:hypothetical protein
MPLTPTSRRCGLPKPDGTPCKRGIAEGQYVCAYHCGTPEGAKVNREKRRSRMLEEEREFERKQLAERVVKCALAWYDAGIYRRNESGDLLHAVAALHEHDTGETHIQAIARWESRPDADVPSVP